MRVPLPNRSVRLHVAVGLLSSALIALQLVLMQVLSVAQWYHFAYMVISVALLGLGASGTLLALAREWFLDRFALLVPVLMLGCGATTAAVVPLSQTTAAQFDAYLLMVDIAQVGSLLLTYLLFFVPFFLGALALGLVFVRHTEDIGGYYFADLLGSGLGGVGALGLLWMILPSRLPAVTALVPIVAGLLILPRQKRRSMLALGAVAVGLAVYAFVQPPELKRSQYKRLSYTMDLPEATLSYERPSPQGLVQVAASPSLRHAPGLSLTYPGDIPSQKGVFNNGNWFGAVTTWTRGDTTHLRDYTTAALPYAMHPDKGRDSVLVLDARTGEEVAHALTRDAAHVTAVEPHRTAVNLIRHELAADTDSLFHHPSVDLRIRESRTHLAASSTPHDLIVLPTVGAFGGTLGLSALEEQYTLTVESLTTMWQRLSPDGVLSITAWMDHPYRTPLKALATLVTVLERAGIDQPRDHLAAVRGWGTITFVMTRSSLTEPEIQNIRAFCDRLQYDPALLPDLQPKERMEHHQMQDDRFFTYIDRLLSDRERFYEAYGFDISPATDDRPYFSQFLQWQRVPDLLDQLGQQDVPFLALGTLIVGLTLLQIAVLAVALILLPLLRIGWRGPGKAWTLLYFGGIGLGFLFVEIVFIQRFTLYLGHPIYATAAVLALLLIGSGIGSALTNVLSTRSSTLWTVAGVVAVVLAVYAVALTPMLRSTIGFPLVAKVPVTLLLIALPAVPMGMPFPLGLRRLSQRSAPQVPWAWGINGCLSVVSTPLAALLAVELGFTLVMIGAAAAYLLVALVSASLLSSP